MQSNRERQMLQRTQTLMVAVSLIPLVVLLYISWMYVFEPLQDQGQYSTVYALFATISLTAVVVMLGYSVVRRDTIRTIEAIGEGETRLERLRQSTAALAALEDPQRLREALIAEACALIGAGQAALWNREEDDLRAAVASGLSLERAQEHPLPIGQGLVGLAAEQRQGILNGTLSDTDRSWDDRVKTRTLGSVIIPLVRGAEVVAVLDLRNKTGGRAFDGADLELANALAQQSVLFLDNARFHDAQGQYQAAVNDLVRDVTEKQLTWPGHIDNVHAICERLAHRVGLPDDKLAALRLAVAVHDIGLLDVDRVDAGPPGGPADHAARGGERLEAMASWAEAAPIVRAHHEMMDGSGPLGLRGFAIPMAARILALAEYVDSVTNPASPWGRKSVDDIIAELKDPDDRRFDPTVVKAFLTEQGSNLDDPELDEMEVVHPL